jgi:signal transduction histidine kinase
MVNDPRQDLMFPTLPIDKIREMCLEGEEITLRDGEEIFRQGDRDYPFYVVLEGRIRVIKHLNDEEMLLVVHGPGQFTGEISMLTGAPVIASGRAEGPTRVVRFTNEEFRRMIAECPQLAAPVLRAFAARAREVDASIVQQEKLAALGKLAAGLAHELNNPASAMVRTVESLRGAVSRVSKLGMQYDCRFDAAERPILDKMQQYAREHVSDPDAISPVERSDREESIASWLEENGMKQAWEMAPGLVNAGLTRECLTMLSGKLKPETLSAALTWLEADLTTSQLAAELESAASRISELVQAMKQYAYMDQAKFQEIDIHDGLESTLKIFAHRIKKGIEVRRDYDRSLPRICAWAGELNQVWTNLISNAVDAMQEHGVLTVSTRRDGEYVMVAIGDSGPGIAPEIREHLFEAFVTTKPAGKGTGLGLDTAQRIVSRRHQGRIDVESKPGDTRFEVRLPIEQRRDHEVHASQPDQEREAAFQGV